MSRSKHKLTEKSQTNLNIKIYKNDKPQVPFGVLFVRCLGIAAFLVFATSTWAQSVVDSPFLQVVREAAYAYPQTQSAAQGLEAARQDQTAATWQRIASPSFQRISPQGNNTSGQINRLALEQPIYAGGRITAGIDAAEHRYYAAYQQHQYTAQETAIKVINAWYEWQRQNDRVITLQDGVRAHRQLRDQIQRRAQESVSPEIDLSLAIARLSQMQSELAQAQSAASTGWALLMQLAADQLPTLNDTASVLNSSLLPRPVNEWVTLSLERDPLLAKLSEEQAAAEADIRVKKAQWLPSVSVVVERNYGSDLVPHQRTWLQVSAQPGAGLSSLANVRAAIARQESAAEMRRNAERELKQSMTADLANYVAATEQMSVAHLLRKSTQDVADSYARQFVAGRKSWLDVLNAVRETVQARLSVLDARSLQGQTAWRLHIRAYGLEQATSAGGLS
jgi:adhesin transport system outer membrane protein